MATGRAAFKRFKLERLVLDVGYGSGYHMWRMLGEGAEAVIGLDPTLLFNLQFALFKHYAPQAPYFNEDAALKK